MKRKLYAIDSREVETITKAAHSTISINFPESTLQIGKSFQGEDFDELNLVLAVDKNQQQVSHQRRKNEELNEEEICCSKITTDLQSELKNILQNLSIIFDTYLPPTLLKKVNNIRIEILSSSLEELEAIQSKLPNHLEIDSKDKEMRINTKNFTQILEILENL